MGLRVTMATTAEEVDAVQRFRHHVFVDLDELREPREDGRIVDRWDVLDPRVCRLLVADIDGEIVGTLRLTIPGSLGTPADDDFPFSRYLDASVPRVAGSALCVHPEYRRTGMVTHALISMFYHHARVLGADEIYAAVNPEQWRMFRFMRAQRLVDDTRETHEGLPFVPFVFRMADLIPPFVKFLDRHDLHGFLDVFERQFHRRGEVVARRGTLADRCYVVVGGEATIRRPDGALLRLDRPTLFGDEAMLVGGDWPYDVVASEALELIVLDRAAYLERVAARPDVAVKFARVQLEAQPPLRLAPPAEGDGHQVQLPAPQGDANRDGHDPDAPVAQEGGQRRS